MRRGKVLIATMIFAVATVVAGASTLEEVTKRYEKQEYPEVIPLLVAYRDEPNGRIWQVDFMLGASLCRVQGQGASGVSILKLVLKYPLSDVVRVVVENEIHVCETGGQQAPGDAGLQLVSAAPQVNGGPLIAGKGGYDFSRSETVQSKVERVPVAAADLRKRVFPPDRLNEAVLSAKNRLHDGWATNAAGFVIAGDRQLIFPPEMIANCLSRYKAPLAAEFDLRLPPELVTVYVAEDLVAVRRYAGVLHGANLPMGTVAYSVYEDRSIVGMASAEGCGSLAHELVHLAIRRNFGDSPAWLQEGLASEVAVALPKETGLSFKRSWRDTRLQEHWALRPTVARLLQADWTSLIPRDQADSDRVVALQAMAAVFVRYLDAKGKLVSVFRAVRDEPWSPTAGPRRDTAAILAEQLAMNLDAIDADFMTWFGYKPPSSPPAPAIKAPEKP